ncbi:YALI0C12056p [Yarrowia lipolytica CLIB122]|uniref:glucan endo-1,3-beta-D-glucosidase n=1 Tax=Yarrowia lipolytica (strain CLIB 122 / E 150) TaxID=284591 RepID=Q6CC66_YARLI|nr:YALI0C12056p [Yarrowia lipolytica CLIB122]KAB8282398.1 endo-1,3(4)-beta-glucanase [Yarrowia lipolytica]KAE8171700.1 endo-1,3(4)-beta-glucanase [Yarrowia lipolytica]KAJ8053364.1 endo-1,3(4)-beta-glucanase [Yarrowia lipolytica]RMI95349.1 endo-1,3(4)-beta-glucanase [Yarrowia lipolytica]CAG82056.2 YALI0C12056p [Yarrowia lipolytica CLIB122]|eukprot:XP_501746.2 YALI0C12056p [Yarrowia lipolytica CLIB122]
MLQRAVHLSLFLSALLLFIFVATHSRPLIIVSDRPTKYKLPATKTTTSIQSKPTAMFNGNPFVPIATSDPMSQFERREHPLKPPVARDGPQQTNKFYANMLLGDRDLPAYVYPYSVWWSKTDNFQGLAISHTRASQLVYGPDPDQNPSQFYFNPVGIMSLVLGAHEFSQGMDMVVDKMDHLSVDLQIGRGPAGLTAPLVRGMGMVTAKYNGVGPIIGSQVGFANIERVQNVRSDIQKYKLTLNNQVVWIMYVNAPDGALQFNQSSPQHFAATSAAQNAVIQIAVLPETPGSEQALDAAAGKYATGGSVSGTIDNDGLRGIYSLEFPTEGQSQCGFPLMYALEHQSHVMVDEIRQRETPCRLDTCAKGVAIGYNTDRFTMAEQTLPRDIGFLPKPLKRDLQSQLQDQNALRLIFDAASKEMDQDINGQANLDSMYFSGKGVDKFATILLVLNDVLGDKDRARTLLDRCKQIFSMFATNKQQNPLVYDTTWKGVISVAGFNDPNADFGNTYYNDHHFHFSYFIHAAAIIAKVDAEIGDGQWLNQNREWVDTLLRDAANPSHDDRHFPVSRSFDWYMGHSWAKGLFLSADGKDEESSSEDYHFAYGMKLWGQVSGNQAMEARANLMLAVMRRAMNIYWFMKDDNTNQPAKFIKNKVPGITFENKVDHATYFGINPEFIIGIHMLPTTPISSYMRDEEFVRQEWDQRVSTFVDGVDSGWKGILQLDRALFDPNASWKFFTQGMQPQWLDPGMSLAWSLTMIAGMGGK